MVVLLGLTGCSALFTFSPEQADAAVTDAATAPEASTDAAADAPASRVSCRSAEDCSSVDGTECLCGHCVAQRGSCQITSRTYVRTDGVDDCLPAPRRIDSAFAHTCVVTYDGGIWCWGNNQSAQLGHEPGVQDFSSLPVPVPRDPAPPAIDVAVGYSHSCALLAGGTVECWGAGDQIGANVEAASSATPLQVVKPDGPLTGIEGIATNGLHTCGMDGSGVVWCWGEGGQGQIDGAPAAPSLVAVNAFVGATVVAACGGATCVSGGPKLPVQCWGRDVLGALGRNRQNCGATEVVLPVGEVLVESTGAAVGDAYVLGLGNRFGCAVHGGAHEIWCWGQNARHALGDQADPVGQDGDTACGARRNVLAVQSWVREIVAGTDFACALYDNDDLYCWGSNDQSQLGRETGGAPGAPALTLSGVRDAAAGFSHACAILTDGRIVCWGSSSVGQLGNGRMIEHVAPVDAAPLCP